LLSLFLAKKINEFIFPFLSIYYTIFLLMPASVQTLMARGSSTTLSVVFPHTTIIIFPAVIKSYKTLGTIAMEPDKIGHP
jgi:hypothetical protein